MSIIHLFSEISLTSVYYDSNINTINIVETIVKTFKYQRIKEMKPREGVKYATRYYIQTPQEKARMREYLLNEIRLIYKDVITYPELNEAAHWHLPGFPKTNGVNRTFMELLEDMAGECVGTKKDGSPKDFALAPVDRWNKMFAGSQWEIALVEADEFEQEKFEKLFEFG